MPYCKNNPKRSYKGNEPSPKGLGFCASGEKEGKKMKGLDGNIWVKKEGRWIKDNTKKGSETKNIHKGYKTYLTHDNYQRPFLVAIKGKNVKIYRVNPKIHKHPINLQRNQYDYLIKEYVTKKIFIGKSVKNKLTEFSSGYGKKFDGNTILLELPDGKCIFIGESIYQFLPSNNIELFYSPVGNNDVPYPFAIDKENIYFIIDKTYVPIKYLPKLTKMTGLYGFYYGYLGAEPLEKYAKKMKGVKIIQKRL